MARLRRSKAAENEFFPGFTDIAEIGIGSLATVYRAREVGTNRSVALKLLNVRDASPRAIESFERESVALGAVSSHPNIVTLYRSFRAADGRPVLVLELCRGSIGDTMVDGQGLPVAEVVALGIKIAGALETAHRAEILHRDVKPQNILITEFGEPALADFGVAMLQSSTQTTAGLFDFTTLHAAPELLEGGETSAATDVYELASSLYQLIAGKSAFRAYDGESPASVILRILRDPVQPLVNAQVPTRLSDLLVGAMSKDKSDRPPTAAEFATELAEVEAAQGWPRTQFLIRDPDGHSSGLPSITRMPTLRPPGTPPFGYSPPAAAVPPPAPQWSTASEHDEPASTDWSTPSASGRVAEPPVAPEPVAPEPVALEPVAPEPVAPEPVAPEPVVPEPVAPEPVAPELVAPEPVVPEPEPVAPDLSAWAPVEQPAVVEPAVAEPEVVEPEAEPTPPPADPAASLWAAKPAVEVETERPEPIVPESVDQPEPTPPPAAAADEGWGEPVLSRRAEPEPEPVAEVEPQNLEPEVVEPQNVEAQNVEAQNVEAQNVEPEVVQPQPPASPDPASEVDESRRAIRIDDDDWSAPRVVGPETPTHPPTPPAATPPPTEPARQPEPAPVLRQPEPPPPVHPLLQPPPVLGQQYPIPPAAQVPPPALPGYPEDEGTTSVPTWAFRAPAGTGTTPAVPGVPPPAAGPGDLTLDPTSLRRRVTIRSGMQSLTVDEQRLLLRAWFRKSELRWPDVRGFEVRFEGADASGGGHLVALTASGPVDLPATRRTASDLRYVQALLDAYRLRAQLAVR